MSPSSPANKRPLHLLRYFSLISLICIVVTSLLLNHWVQKNAQENLLNSEERNNVALTHILASSIWLNFPELLQRTEPPRPVHGELTATESRLEQFINLRVAHLNVIKIKIYDAAGKTIYSSNHRQIGQSVADTADFKRAISGQVSSKLSFRDRFYAQQELIENRNIISSYVPIYPLDETQIIGVFEVYKDVTPSIQHLEQTLKRITVGVASLLSALFLVQYFFIRRADCLIRQHHDEQEKVHNEIRHVAYYDNLTSLPNRVLFMQRLEHALLSAEQSQRLAALLFIDLDRFKQVNDNLGHEAGDTLLKIIAERLTDCVRTGDIVARFSGDEFTVLLENLSNVELAGNVAQRIIHELSVPVELGRHKIHISASIGISLYPFADDDVDSLIKKADAAMYFSKSTGRNRYHVFSPDMYEHDSKNYAIESDLNTAITEHQFELYFQPKINIADWKMHSMEALLRWNHPHRGLISPDEFIPVLEETGKIISVGEQVIQRSCEILKSWHDEGLETLSVAVNVSALQFRQPDFYDMVDNILNRTGLSAQHLELEITESTLLDDAQNCIEIMHRLKQRGVRLTIDDFGTGYSSLNYLSRLPVDTLKIDRHFVKDLHNNRESRSIITAIISFAHGLNIDIVAEGIEDMKQLTFLSAMRCTSVQGFMFSKPLSQAAFYDVYRSGGDFSDIISQQKAG